MFVAAPVAVRVCCYVSASLDLRIEAEARRKNKKQEEPVRRTNQAERACELVYTGHLQEDGASSGSKICDMVVRVSFLACFEMGDHGQWFGWLESYVCVCDRGRRRG